MIELQQIGMELVKNNLDENTSIMFNERCFNFYYDNNGQRLHYIIPYVSYGYSLENQYIIKRLLSFCNEEDKGKEDAILGVLDLNKSKVISIHKTKVEFEFFTIVFRENSSGNRNVIKTYYK